MPKTLPKSLKIVISLALILFAVTLSTICAEIFLRNYYGLKYGYKYYPWPPYLSRKIEIMPGVFPGVSGTKNFYINSIGTRGDEPTRTDTYRIVAMGGSTTESGELDEQETWPKLLQISLNQNSQKKVWVGNAARRGSTLRDNILQMKYFVSQINSIDTIILLSGINDFMLSISTDYQSVHMIDSLDPTESQLDHAFSVHPYTNYKLKGTAIWSLLKQSKIALFGRNIVHDNEGGAETFWRGKRANSTGVLKNLPNIDAGLAEYEDNLNLFVDLAKLKSQKIILLTQPSIYKKNMSEDELNLLWFGCVEQDGWKCYSPEVLAKGLDKFNQITLQVCKNRQIECIDLASKLPKDTTIFFDDVHFNENGAKEVSKIIYDYFQKSQLF